MTYGISRPLRPCHCRSRLFSAGHRLSWEMLSLLLLVSFFFSLSSASNPPSVVIDLNERFLEVKDDGLWIVKFYAPWCAHCKRLVPTWEHLGHALQDKNLPIRVAKMDCTRFQSACQTMQIRGYPTIFFFRNGKTVEFHGERTKEALVNFAEKCSADVVEKVNAVKISDMRRKAKHDPFFLIVADSDDALREEFMSAAEKLFSKVRFVSAAAESVPQELRDTDAKVAVFKDDIFMTFDGQPDEFYSWVLRERWPLFPQALHSNIAEMATSGKLLVLSAVSDLDRFNMSSPTGQFYEKVATAAKEMKKSEILWEQFQFAWLDGSDIVSGIAMTKMAEPAILVFNYTSYEFFMPFDEPEKMTSNSIITWLEQLNDGISSGTAVPLGGRGWLTRARRLVYDVYTNVAQMFASQPLLSCCLFGVPIAFLSIICYSICSADFSVERDEFYPDEEEEELLTDTEDGQQHENYDPDHQKNE